MPGRGPGGVPRAIGLTPILSARYREEDLVRIRAAAPGARLVPISAEGLADADLDEVEVLLRGPISAAVFDRILARCPELTWVHSATAGVERVLTPLALRRDLAITSARGVFTEPIAEYVLLMILSVVRRLPQLLELHRERTWQPLVAREMRDITVGIVGLGSIGQEVARLASAFGARVIATRKERPGATGAAAHPPGVAEVLPPYLLPDLLAQSDFIVLALPYTDETNEIIGEAALAVVRRGAWLINIARGGLVDDRALERALRDGRLGGAILDTLREEPLPPESPLYDVPNLLVTPHTSWSSGRVLDRSIGLFCDNLARYREGAPLLNVVDVGRGY